MTPKSFAPKRVNLRSFASVLLLLALVLGPGSAFSAFAATQEVTGNIQGEVKDQAGAVVPNATVTATAGQQTLTATTDSRGEYRFNNLKPGVYTVTVTASGFSELKRENITVELGKTLQVNLDVQAGGTKEVVTVTASQEPIVDVTSSKTATNISKEKIETLPKSNLGFSSLVDVAPAARTEPSGRFGAGQFQIDGASASENVFIVDGVEVTRVFGGTLGSSKNVPVDFVQEIQVKTGGFEAEYGGATGGVINVVTKGGTDSFHGEIRFDYSSDTFRAIDNPALRLSPLDPAQQTIEYFNNPSGKDKTRFFNPTFLLNGPIYKNKVWFAAGVAPEYTKSTRTVQLIKAIAAGDTSIKVLNSHPITQRQRNDYNYLRIDAQPFSKLSVYGNFIHTPVQTEGILSFASFQSGFQTPSAGTFDNPRYDLQGGYTPSYQTSFGANYSVSSHLILSFRGGFTYLNDKGGNYDIPQNTPNLIISAPCTSSSNIAGASNCSTFTTATGSNIVTNQVTSFDITRRTNLNFDATYITNLLGQHTFKGGYQTNRISNSVLFGFSGGRFQFLFGRARSEPDPNNPGQTIQVRGNYGYYVRDEFARSGDVSGRNQGIFFQDSWQIHRRVTLNLGLRVENEFLPAYPISAAGHPTIPAEALAQTSTKPVDFGWGDKVAPRIGGAWDVFGNGRLVAAASYSVFYDTMKYGLARGSFGGEVFLRSFCKLNTGDVSAINLSTPCDIFEGPSDLRFPSIVPLPGQRPGIDPNLKPYREHEYSARVEYTFSRDLLVGARFTRKALDNAIEDIGGVDAAGNEFFTIGNPGRGTAVSDFNPPTPKAIREYTALELRVDKRLSNHYYINGSYTYSKLYGNYSGLGSSDEAARTDTNTNRDFDLPFLNFLPQSAGGGLSVGRLATDRPNTFKFFGGYLSEYSLFHRRMRTDIGVGERIYQGIPLTTEVPTVVEAGSGANAFLGGRGNSGRTPWFTQTDLNVTHYISINERARLLFRINVTNLWDERNVTEQFRVILGPGQSLFYPTTDAFLNGNFQQDIANQHLVTDPRYLRANGFQAPREARIAVGFQF